LASGTLVETGDGVGTPFRLTANGTASTPTASQTLTAFEWTLTFVDQGNRVVVISGAPGAAPTTVTDSYSTASVVVASVIGTTDSWYIDAASKDIWGDITWTLKVTDSSSVSNTLS
jgi:hypothetical protein